MKMTREGTKTSRLDKGCDLTCNCYTEARGQPECAALKELLCIGGKPCKFRGDYFPPAEKLRPPCRAQGADCPRREVGCHATCLDWRRYAAEKERRKALQTRRDLTEEYLIERAKHGRR